MHYYWEIDDGRIWDATNARFVLGVEAGKITPLYQDGEPAGVDYLRKTILFYGYKLGLEIMKKAEIQDFFTSQIQLYLDAFAQSIGYDGILSATTYATSMVEKFRVEGQYAVEARDTTWAKAYVILNEVESGKRPMPVEIGEILSDLPALVWPG